MSNVNYYMYDLRNQVLVRTGCNAYCRDTDLLDEKNDEINGTPITVNWSVDGNKLYVVGRLSRQDVCDLYERAKHIYSYYSN